MENVVVLKLGRQQYGLPVTEITEIIQMVAVTEVPQLPPGVLGMINYRGAVIPLLDLRQLCETLIQNVRLNSMIVVANSRAGKLGLLVDGVQGVRNHDLFEYTQMEQHPVVKSILKTEGEVILMLNMDRLAASVEQFMALG